MVTFATDCSEWLSGRINNDYNTVILGLGTQWYGFGSRILALREFLRTIPGNSTVFWADAGDVAILPGCTTKAIIETFKTFESPIVFAGEMYCWPDSDKHSLFPEPPHDPKFYKFLNAGSSVGYAWAYQSVIDFMDLHDPISIHFDDQRFWQQAYLKQISFEKHNQKPFFNNGLDVIPFIQVDFYQKLLVAFGALNVGNKPSSELFDYSEYNISKRITFVESGGKPCIFHQPGTKIKGQPAELQKILDKVHSIGS